MLNQRAPSDLWSRTLSQIPSVFGRLVYLSSLRNSSGVYEHHGFMQQYGTPTAQAAMLSSHAQAFMTWLNYSLEEQKADLDLYLADVISERQAIIETWLRLSSYRNITPVTARDSERRKFQADFDTLLELLRRENRLSKVEPEA